MLRICLKEQFLVNSSYRSLVYRIWVVHVCMHVYICVSVMFVYCA